MNILLITQDFTPPWNNGIKSYTRGLVDCIKMIGNINIININSNDLTKATFDNIDFIHLVNKGGIDTFRLLNKINNHIPVLKHVITPPINKLNKILTYSFYTLNKRLKKNLIPCVSSKLISIQYGITSEYIIPPAINTDVYKPVYIEDNTINNILGKDLNRKHNKLILYMGPLTEDRFPYRNIIDILSYIQSDLLIIGRGTNPGEYETFKSIIRYSENKGGNKGINIFLKSLNENEKIAIINYSDIIIQPFTPKLINSSNIAVDPPILILEAMSCGKCVITSNTYSLSTIIKQGYNGFIIDFNDKTQLIDILSVDDYKKICENARNTIIQNFSNYAVSKMLLDAYKKLQ
jgi:glycosyltransferase involved in cell wall biosynthesis